MKVLKNAKISIFILTIILPFLFVTPINVNAITLEKDNKILLNNTSSFISLIGNNYEELEDKWFINGYPKGNDFSIKMHIGSLILDKDKKAYLNFKFDATGWWRTEVYASSDGKNWKPIYFACGWDTDNYCIKDLDGKKQIPIPTKYYDNLSLKFNLYDGDEYSQTLSLDKTIMLTTHKNESYLKKMCPDKIDNLEKYQWNDDYGCVYTEEICINYDGGKNYYTKGTVEKTIINEVSSKITLSTNTDFCSNGLDDYTKYYPITESHTLGEYYCGDIYSSPTIAFHDCKCFDGACVDSSNDSKNSFYTNYCGDNICNTIETPKNCPKDCSSDIWIKHENIYTLDKTKLYSFNSLPASYTNRSCFPQMQTYGGILFDSDEKIINEKRTRLDLSFDKEEKIFVNKENITKIYALIIGNTGNTNIKTNTIVSQTPLHISIKYKYLPTKNYLLEVPWDEKLGKNYSIHGIPEAKLIYLGQTKCNSASSYFMLEIKLPHPTKEIDYVMFNDEFTDETPFSNIVAISLTEYERTEAGLKNEITENTAILNETNKKNDTPDDNREKSTTQKQTNDFCQNNYECAPNFCINEKCTAVKKNPTFLKKVSCKLLYLFNDGRYATCLWT